MFLVGAGSIKVCLYQTNDFFLRTGPKADRQETTPLPSLVSGAVNSSIEPKRDAQKLMFPRVDVPWLHQHRSGFHRYRRKRMP